MPLVASDKLRGMIAAVLIELEGEWSDDPTDYGRYTRWGISSRFFPQVRSSDFSFSDALEIVNQLAEESRTLDIIQLTGGDYELGIFFLMFHIHVGLDDSIPLLQAVLREETADLKMDGIFGPKTAEALVVSYRAGNLLARLKTACRGFYVARALGNGQKHLLAGFVNRMTVNFDRAFALASSRGERLVAWSNKSQPVGSMMT